MSDRRIGRFTISRKLIEEEPLTVKLMFSGCIVVRAEMLYDMNAIEYTAICDEFEPLEEGRLINWYDAVLERVRGGTDEEPVCRTVFKGWVKQ